MFDGKRILIIITLKLQYLPLHLIGAIQVLFNAMLGVGCQIPGKNGLYCSTLLALRGEGGCQISRKKCYTWMSRRQETSLNCQLTIIIIGTRVVAIIIIIIVVIRLADCRTRLLCSRWLFDDWWRSVKLLHPAASTKALPYGWVGALDCEDLATLEVRWNDNNGNDFHPVHITSN